MAAAAAERSTHDVVYAATIAASAAIIGGIIGGSIPGYFTLKAEDKRHAHAGEIATQVREDERERERRAIIGTARVLHEFFERVGAMFGVALDTKRWWSDELDATLQPPSLDDQKVVLEQLTSYEAGVFATTMRAIEMLRATRVSFREVDTLQLESGRTAAQNAARCLWRAADLPTPPTTNES